MAMKNAIQETLRASPGLGPFGLKAEPKRHTCEEPQEEVQVQKS